MKHVTCLFSALIMSASVFAAPAKASSCGSDIVLAKTITPSAANTYEVLRKGKPIGTHTISFYPNGEQIKVLAETEMKVDVLFITAFKYNYRSEEIYCGGQLQSSTTWIDNNGKESDVMITHDGDGYLSDGRKGLTRVAEPFVTSNHWTMEALGATEIMNTATGLLDGVTVTPGQDMPGGRIYEVRGDIDYDTRYSPEGHWLGMTFEHPKGGTIEFRCLDCRNTPLGRSMTSSHVNSGMK